jgi:hypothetical protein
MVRTRPELEDEISVLLMAQRPFTLEDESVNSKIRTLIQDYEHTATSAIIRGEVWKIGPKVQVVEERVREKPGFKELWERKGSAN